MQPPIIIVAAGRSGTKLLRDLLCAHSQLTTWPCDEINPIWRYGSVRYPTDELPPERATSRVQRYIRGQFRKISRMGGGARVVEKTCANSLRVPYVHRVVPEARFIHLVRDGRDVAASARRRWRGETETGYLLRKARWVPAKYLPYYAYDVLRNRAQQIVSRERQRPTWGPRFEGIDELVRQRSLIEVCGIQWARCVEAAYEGFESVPSSQVLDVRYEHLVERPKDVFGEILTFVGLDFEDEVERTIDATIDARNVGKWREQLSQDDRHLLMPHIRSTMDRRGYLERQGHEADQA